MASIGKCSHPMFKLHDWGVTCADCGDLITQYHIPVQGYYFFPWNVQTDPDDPPAKPKPTCTLDVLKSHEEAVEKVLNDMPRVQKLIIYRTLNASGTRMEGINREIQRECAQELKAIKAIP